MMKNNMKKYIAIFCLMSGLTSCTDLLTETPESYYDSTNYFVSVPNANMAVAAVYNTLGGMGHYGQAEMAIPTSDDMYYVSGTNTDNLRRDISHYMVSTNNQWIESTWDAKYQGLDRANFALDGIRSMKEYATGNEILKKYEGELCFLRAFIALQLVRNWGDVPYKTTYTASVSDAYSPRVDRELIYDLIMLDLEIARTQLPWADANTSPERATQGAARALTMRALLQRAGYSLKADAKLSRPSEDKRKEYFNAILTEWEAFKKNGFHNFYSGGYEQAWKNYCQNVDEPVETLWEIAFYTPDGKAPGAGMWGTYIGPSTDQASVYGRANSFFVVLPTWASFYDENDIRRDVNICQYKIDNKSQKVYNAKPYDPAKPATSPDTPSNKFYYPGKWRREWIGVGMSKDPNNTDVDYAVLRYPDVVLMVAEAMNELDRTDEAVELLNMVRKRAGITELKKDFSNYAVIYKAPKVIDLDFIDDSTPAGKFRTALYWERGFELCYEGTRKYDLIRWGILKESLENMYTYMKSTENFPDGDPKKYKYALNAFPAGKGDRFVTGKHELFPIPLMEIQRNKALGSLNNPGY